MQTLAEILEAAQRLSDGERRQLVAELQGDNGQELTAGQCRDTLLTWLSLAGTFHADFVDVSTDKYTHLADVYSDER